jgi:hypothetical protein
VQNDQEYSDNAEAAGEHSHSPIACPLLLFALANGGQLMLLTNAMLKPAN